MNQLETVFRDMLTASLVASGMACVIFAIFCFTGKRIPAKWRHLLLLLVLVRLCFFITPVSDFSWDRLVPEQTTAAEIVAKGTAEPDDSSRNAEPRLEGIDRQQRAANTSSIDARILESSKPAIWSKFLVAIPVVWIVGSVLFGIRILLGVFQLHRLVSVAGRSIPDNIARVFSETISEFPVKKSPRLLITDRVDTPALAGLFRPVILFPSGQVENPSEREIRLIFIHELGHLRRFDLWVNFSMLLVQAIHWFNPVVWFTFKRIRIEAEKACDAWVLSRLDDEERPQYGNALLNLLDTTTKRQKSHLGAIGILESRRDLHKRMADIGAFRKTNQIFAAVCVGILSVIFGITMFTQSAEKGEGITVEFVAVDVSGNPIADAAVVIKVGKERDDSTVIFPPEAYLEIARGKTDGKGHFKKVFPKYDQVSVWVSTAEEKKKGVRVFRKEPVELQPGMHVEHGPSLVLHEMKDVEFQFVDSEGKPVEGMHVETRYIFLGYSSRFFGEHPISATTDNSGRCILKLPDQCKFYLDHDRPDLQLPATKAPILPPGDGTEIVFHLKKATTLSGKVSLPDGTPIKGVYVGLIGMPGSRTDDEGNYLIEHLGITDYLFSINIPAPFDEGYFIPAEKITVLEDVEQSKHNFIAQKGAVIHVRYLDSDTNDLISIITRRNMNPKATSIDSVSLGLPDGYHATAYNKIEFSFGDKREITVDAKIKKITESDTIRGTVTDAEGVLLAGAKVYVYPKIFYDPVITNEKGEFAYTFMDREIDGHKQATAYAEFKGLNSAIAKWERGGPPVTLQLLDEAPAIIEGTVVDSGGKPISNAEILLWSIDFFRHRITVRTNEKGQYRFGKVRPGKNLIVKISHPDYSDADYRGKSVDKKWQALRAKPGETVSIPDVSLRGANKSISGTVVDSFGKPMANMFVRVQRFNTPGQAERDTRTDPQGKFKLEGLIDDWISLRVMSQPFFDDLPWKVERFHAGEKGVVIKMPQTKKRIFFQPDKLDFVGKMMPEITVEKWINTDSPPALKSGEKIRVIFFAGLDRPLSYLKKSVRHYQKMQNDHPNAEFILIHGFWPEGEIREGIEEIEKKRKLTIPIGVEPFIGGASEKFQLSYMECYVVDTTGKVVFQSIKWKAVSEYLKKIDPAKN